jgi:hypothetical protein
VRSFLWSPLAVFILLPLPTLAHSCLDSWPPLANLTQPHGYTQKRSSSYDRNGANASAFPPWFSAKALCSTFPALKAQSQSQISPGPSAWSIIPLPPSPDTGATFREQACRSHTFRQRVQHPLFHQRRKSLSCHFHHHLRPVSPVVSTVYAGLASLAARPRSPFRMDPCRNRLP